METYREEWVVYGTIGFVDRDAVVGSFRAVLFKIKFKIHRAEVLADVSHAIRCSDNEVG